MTAAVDWGREIRELEDHVRRLLEHSKDNPVLKENFERMMAILNYIKLSLGLDVAEA